MQWRTPIGTRLTQYVKRMYILTSESKTHITVGQYSLVTNELWQRQRHTKLYLQKYISHAFHETVHVFMGEVVPKKRTTRLEYCCAFWYLVVYTLLENSYPRECTNVNIESAWSPFGNQVFHQ